MTAPAVVRSTVSVGDGPWSINLVTGLLERGNGQPLGVLALGSPGSISDRPGSSPWTVRPHALVKNRGQSGSLMDGPPDRQWFPTRRLDDDYDVAVDATVQEAARILRAAHEKVTRQRV